ncbi:MAG TPA: hypothetical protein VKU19_17785 [Bryobacteraceae bacterium]|nr:hypothetical protein [Bryobacteraceae bacterium]
MKLLIFCMSAVTALSAADFPQADISNGVLQAKLYLPDAQQGYYRATRFDWSGVIASLEYKGHNFFGQWFDTYDPKIHDAIMGPVEEFLTPNRQGLGYDEVKPGENFVKIGVGAIRKPEEPRFRQFGTYDIADSGKWSVRKGADFVEFTQELNDTAGYAYLYRKTVRLTPGKPELVLEHSLKNTGKKTIDTIVYEHNFYMLDNQPASPDYVVHFPFDLRLNGDLKGLAELRGKDFTYLKELEKGQTAAGDLEGFGNTAKDYDIRVENKKAGIGVRQVGDQPITRMYFWSIRSTVCPEAYISMKIDPGKEHTWRIAYEFYTLNK